MAAAIMAPLTSLVCTVVATGEHLAPRAHPDHPGLCHMGSTLARIAGGSALKQHGGHVRGECRLQQGAADHAPATMPILHPCLLPPVGVGSACAGVQHRCANVISHNHLTLFFAQVPWAVDQQEPIPSNLLVFLDNKQPAGPRQAVPSCSGAVFSRTSFLDPSSIPLRKPPVPDPPAILSH